MGGKNDIKIKGLDISDSSGNVMALTHFANRGDKNDKGENKIEIVDEVKAKGSKGNLKVLTDFAQRGKVSQSGRQVLRKPQT
ncbi:hypothetical protein ACE6H2_004971 [Prunus campanulata]